MQGLERNHRSDWDAAIEQPERTRKLIDDIDIFLQTFDLVLLIMNGSGAAENLAEDFMESEALRKAAKKILVLSDRDIRYTNTHHQYCQLGTEDLDVIRNIYFLYDFSDHFRVLSDSRQYGGLLEYMKTGVFTMEEIFQAALES